MPDFLKISSATDIGGRRHQEDQIVVIESADSAVVAIFDGHGGPLVSAMAALQLQKIADKPLDEIFAELVRVTNWMDEGSTATIAKITADKVEYGVMGDSPIALMGTNPSSPHYGFWHGPNHNVRTNLKERAAAEARGGYYGSGYIWNRTRYSGLQMSRALGDGKFGDILLREPEMGTLDFHEHDVLILASDGVEYENNELIRLFDFENAQGIVDDANKRKTSDNVSAIHITRV